MNIKVQNNVILIETTISKELYDEAMLYAPTSRVAKDEHGNALYAVNYTDTGEGNINAFSITCNTVIAGNLALTTILPNTEDRLNFIKHELGTVLAKLAQYEEAVSASLTAAVTPINSVISTIQID